MGGRHEVAGLMADAAARWLDTLDGDDRRTAAWEFPSDEERTRWFYTPTDHGGLPLGSMTPAQQQAGFALLATGLSEGAYTTATTIMGLENVLDRVEGFQSSRTGRTRGRDPLLYYLRLFGEPRREGTWAWRMGGHHVSLHWTIVDGEVISSTPCFLGAHPASASLLGGHLRPLAAVEDTARELIRSLDDAQLADALVSPVAPGDIVTGNRARISPGDRPLPITDIFRERFEGDFLLAMAARQEASDAALGWLPSHAELLELRGPVGVAAGELTSGQRDMLRALLSLYVERMPDAIADEEAATFAGDRLAGFTFAWAGSLEPRQPHYYRIQNDDTVVEYDNVQNEADHVHSVWRSVRNDFGAASLADHYSTSPHHR